MRVTDIEGKNLKKLVAIQDESPQAVDSALSPHFSPDGKWIAFQGFLMNGPNPETDMKGFLYVIKPDGTGKRRLAETMSHFSFSPDSTAIAFMRSGDIFTINMDGRGLKQLTKRHHNCFPLWVP